MKPRLSALVGLFVFIALAQSHGGPAEVPVLFTNTVATGGNTNVFVVGGIPQLGNWDPLYSVKLISSSGVWRGTIGIPEGTSFEYKFIRRATSPDSAYASGANVTWEPDPNRSSSTPPGPPSPYTGKTVFYYSSWSTVSILYSNTIDGVWTFKAMTDVGPGRGAGERLWRVDGLNREAEQNLIYVFTNNQGQWDNPDNVPNRNYETPLDACVVQDGQVFNYWPPPTVSTNRIHTFTTTNYAGVVGRTIRVWVPRGYTQNTTKKYPVLYMHDGNNLFNGMGAFGSWWADTNANNLIRYGKMRETIIVGVDNSNDRFCEYAPPGCTYAQCNTPVGSNYVAMIANYLRPHINNTYSITAGRTLTDAENTGAMGSSLGGLISAYQGWQWSNVFGKLGCFSSSFQVCMPFPAPPATKRNIRVYIDAGTSSDGLANTMTERDRLVSLGYVFNIDLDNAIGFGDAHNEAAWNRRLPRAFTFLFPTSDEPNTVLDSVAPMQVTGYNGDTIAWNSYRSRTYTIQGSTNEAFSSSMNWSNLVTTPPESRLWNYPSLGVTNNFRYLRIRQNTVPNWPN